MLACKLQSRKVAVPAGLSLVVSGLMLNSVAFLLTRTAHPLLGHMQDVSDFMHGLIIGLGIALEIGGLTILAQARRDQREQGH